MPFTLRLLSCAFLATIATGQAVTVTVTAAPGTVAVEPGITENAWLYNGQLAPVIRAVEGRPLRVRFLNQLPEMSIVHFHGQPAHQGMDGVPGLSRPEVASGQEFLYEIDSPARGTYWFHPHSHQHEQVDKGLYGVLIVDPQNAASDPPFDLEQTIVLDEWNDLLGGSGFYGHLLSGHSSGGQAPIVVQPGNRLRLRFVNVAATSNYVVALDGHPMTVTHADGNRVQPVPVQALSIGIGERYDVIVDCLNPGIWSLAVSTIQNRNATVVRGIVQYAGQTGAPPAAAFVPANLASGSLLSYSQLASFAPTTPISPAPNRTYTANLGMSMVGPMTWTINNQAWPNVTPMALTQGDIVQLTMTSTTAGMMHLHPMHLHGHFFRLMGTAGGTTHAPQKDTILVDRMGQPNSTVTVQFTADNPGRWLYHCHDMHHMMMGMMTEFDYGSDADGDGISDVTDMDPTRAFPVLTVPEMEAAFQIGNGGSIDVQWQPGQGVSYLVAFLDLPAPVAMAPYGNLYIDPGTSSVLGGAMVGPTGTASLPYQLPLLPAIRGFRIGLQGIAGTSLPQGVRLSTYQAFTVR